MEGFAEQLNYLDHTFTLGLNGLHSAAMDQVWIFFSGVRNWFPLYALIAVLMLWKLGWKRGLTFIAACALCVVCVDQGANLVKGAVARLRPCHDPDMILAGLYLPDPGQIRSGLYGFFSAHAGNAMSFAVCSSKAFSRRRYSALYTVLIVVWALLVGVSRVFKGAHFLGDVITGWTVGALVGLAIALIASKICKSK